MSFGGKKEWERRYKKKFYSDFPASFHEARLDSLKRSKLKKTFAGHPENARNCIGFTIVQY